ncbi:unnamed protein product [Diabrotica balteata]|uniref:Uncharacterized protein n=1 Tax=Diabrotica balteata TaxID=107213 RepID=A0A9N9X4N2_DIABA|nr:unnamed protein product [Diabrotica balteata]
MISNRTKLMVSMVSNKENENPDLQKGFNDDNVQNTAIEFEENTNLNSEFFYLENMPIYLMDSTELENDNNIIEDKVLDAFSISEILADSQLSPKIINTSCDQTEYLMTETENSSACDILQSINQDNSHNKKSVHPDDANFEELLGRWHEEAGSDFSDRDGDDTPNIKWIHVKNVNYFSGLLKLKMKKTAKVENLNVSEGSEIDEVDIQNYNTDSEMSASFKDEGYYIPCLPVIVLRSPTYLAFGSPATDICGFCIRTNPEINTTKDEEQRLKLKMDLTIHKTRAKQFFKSMKEESADSVTYCFDLQQVQNLPKAPITEALYSQQLAFYAFCVIDILTKTPVFYTWLEHEALRGMVEISFALTDFLKKTDFDPDIKHLRLFSDGCGGQNKNSHMVHALTLWLLNNAPKTI